MEQEEFDALADMFGSKGWKHFIQTAVDLEDALTKGAVDSASTNEQWQYLRGQLHQLRSILGYENYIRQVWKQQEEDAVEFLIGTDDADTV